MAVEREPSTVQDARDNVLDRLAERYEHFAEAEQAARGRNDPVEAEGSHRYALLILRAYQAESGTQ